LELPIDGNCSGISVMFGDGVLSQDRQVSQRLNAGIIRNVVPRPQLDEPIVISDDDSSDDLQVIHVECFQVYVIEIFANGFIILPLHKYTITYFQCISYFYR